MTGRFVEVILPAVEKLKAAGENNLKVETDDISTLVRGDAEKVFAAIRDSFCAAAVSGEHVAGSILFSRGCPGEAVCCASGISPAEEPEPPAEIPAGEGADVEVSAQFSLYPLGAVDYMDRIYGAVDGAKRMGTFTRSKNFCTRLDGPADKVFQSIYESFISTEVSHVVIHATVSANSPSNSERKKKGETF